MGQITGGCQLGEAPEGSDAWWQVRERKVALSAREGVPLLPAKSEAGVHVRRLRQPDESSSPPGRQSRNRLSCRVGGRSSPRVVAQARSNQAGDLRGEGRR